MYLFDSSSRRLNTNTGVLTARYRYAQMSGLHGLYNLEKVLKFTNRLEKFLNSVKVLEKYLISLLGLEKSLKLTTLSEPDTFSCKIMR